MYICDGFAVQTKHHLALQGFLELCQIYQGLSKSNDFAGLHMGMAHESAPYNTPSEWG
jgi:hypothetical protein